jgi:hypothetical protein
LENGEYFNEESFPEAGENKVGIKGDMFENTYNFSEFTNIAIYPAKKK